MGRLFYLDMHAQVITQFGRFASRNEVQLRTTIAQGVHGYITAVAHNLFSFELPSQIPALNEQLSNCELDDDALCHTTSFLSSLALYMCAVMPLTTWYDSFWIGRTRQKRTRPWRRGHALELQAGRWPMQKLHGMKPTHNSSAKQSLWLNMYVVVGYLCKRFSLIMNWLWLGNNYERRSDIKSDWQSPIQNPTTNHFVVKLLCRLKAWDALAIMGWF